MLPVDRLRWGNSKYVCQDVLDSSMVGAKGNGNPLFALLDVPKSEPWWVPTENVVVSSHFR